MIIDKIENLAMYRIVPDHVVDFVKSLKTDIKTGRYELIDKDFADDEDGKIDVEEIEIGK